MGGFTFYEQLYSDYNSVLTSASMAAANQLIGGIAPYLLAALVLVVIIIGVIMMLGRLDQSTGVLWIVRTVAVANLLTSAMYTQWVMTTFLTTIPGAISSLIGVTGVTTPAATFDHLQAGVEKMTATLDAAAEWWDVGSQFRITVAYYFATVPLFLGFWLSIITMAFVSVVAPLGAVLLLFYLFNNTRHYAERWIGKLVSLMILQLIIAILMNIILTEFGVFAARMNAAGNLGDLAERISVLWDMGLGFFVGVGFLIGAPIIAGYIGGGQVTAMVGIPARMATLALARLK